MLKTVPIIEKIKYCLLLTRLERIAPLIPVASPAAPINHTNSDATPHTSAIVPNNLLSFSGLFDGAIFIAMIFYRHPYLSLLLN